MRVKGISLGGDSVAIHLALVAVCIEIYVFYDVQDRTRHNFLVVGIQRFKPIHDLASLFP